jgi:hypothetical protein
LGIRGPSRPASQPERRAAGQALESALQTAVPTSCRAPGPSEYQRACECERRRGAFASGLFTRFDLTVLVAEPTRKGISVYRQWRDYSASHDPALALVGNKVQGPEDAAFLSEHAAGALLACIGYETAVRAMEQGRPLSVADLSPATTAAPWQARPTPLTRLAAGGRPGRAGRGVPGTGW